MVGAILTGASALTASSDRLEPPLQKIWKEPTPTEWDAWEDRIRDGEEPSLVAHDLGQTCSSFRRANAVRHKEALEEARVIQRAQDRDFVRRKLRENVAKALGEQPVGVDKRTKTDPETGETTTEEIPRFTYRGEIAARSLELIAKGAGEYDGTSRVELTGAGGGPVVIEDRSASLADVARVLEAVGALTALGGATVGGEVPAARGVLAAPGDD